MTKPRIAVLASIVRSEEKAIFRALDDAGMSYSRLDTRSLIHSSSADLKSYDVVINRSIGQTAGFYAVSYMENFGAHCINSAQTISVCGNKALTAMAFQKNKILTPGWRIASSPNAALEAVEDLGFPSVFKPLVGSWGRLIARADDRNSAEAIIEHKQALPGAENKVFFIQEYVNKPGRDIRVIAIGGEPILAYARYSEHWKTNVKLGARTSAIPINGEIGAMASRIASALGGDFLSIDLMECPERGIVANEVNHTPEFMGAIEATGIDIAGALTEYTKGIASC